MKYYKLHILKTITWRIIGTVDTIIIGWLLTGNPMTGVKLGGFELVSKSIFYYAHERMWFKIINKNLSKNENL